MLHDPSQALAVRLRFLVKPTIAFKQALKFASLTENTGPKLASMGSSSPPSPAITPASGVPAPGPTITWPPTFSPIAPFAVTVGVNGTADIIRLAEKDAPSVRP